MSPIESGELCLFASVMAESGDIVYPKLDPATDMIPFDAVVKDMLDEMGFGCRACGSSAEAKAAMRELNCAESSARSTRSTRLNNGIGYPCEFFGSDTSGEKTFEEFYTDTDVKDEATFLNLGVVKNSKKRPALEVEAIFANLRKAFAAPRVTKADIIDVLKDYLPNFQHIEKGKSLDARM